MFFRAVCQVLEDRFEHFELSMYIAGPVKSVVLFVCIVIVRKIGNFGLQKSAKCFNNAKDAILFHQSRHFQLDIHVLPGAVKNLVLSLSHAPSWSEVLRDCCTVSTTLK